MSFTSPPSATSRLSYRPGDDLDALLRDFYQTEMPHPWPEPELPRAAMRSAQPAFWHRVKTSHLALAASVALLICGSLLLPGRLLSFRATSPSTGEEIGSSPKEIVPERVKESIIVTPDGAAVRFELTEVDENHY